MATENNIHSDKKRNSYVMKDYHISKSTSVDSLSHSLPHQPLLLEKQQLCQRSKLRQVSGIISSIECKNMQKQNNLECDMQKQNNFSSPTFMKNSIDVYVPSIDSKIEANLVAKNVQKSHDKSNTASVNNFFFAITQF